MAILKVDTISGIGTEGPVFEGDIEFTSQNFLTLPKGNTTQRGRGRAVIFAGYVSSPGATTEEIVYFDIATSGTSLRFGDLGVTQGATGGAVASSTRAVYGGGWTSPGIDISYVTIATEGNSIDFGADRNSSKGKGTYAPGCGNATRGIFISSQNHPAYYGNTDFVTIATTGSWADFGDLHNGANGYRYTNGSSSDTRALVYSGNWTSPVVDGPDIAFITIASLGDSIDFGDAIKSGTHRGGFSNSIRGGAAGGFYPSADFNTIEFVNIATTGNGIDWGDLTTTRAYNQGTTSDSHGGIAE